MGADMMLYTVPAAEITPARKARLLEIVDRLTKDDVKEWLDNGYSKNKRHLQQELRVAIDHLADADLSREVCGLHCQGMRFRLLTTGGMSWGDDPTEMTSTFRLIACCEPLDKQLMSWAQEDFKWAPGTTPPVPAEATPDAKPVVYCVDLPDPTSLGSDDERWTNVGRFSTRSEAVEFIQDHIGPCDIHGRVALITTVERLGGH